MSLRNKVRLALIFGDLLEKYATLDPDQEAVDPGDDDVKADLLDRCVWGCVWGWGGGP